MTLLNHNPLLQILYKAVLDSSFTKIWKEDRLKMTSREVVGEVPIAPEGLIQ